MTIEVIEAPDGAATEMVRRVPSTGSGEFKLGAQVVVRESQSAVFFRDGKSYDVFGPGRHTLSTLNLPLIAAPITNRIFGESPFKAEVYFVNHNVFLNIKWGTRDPVAYRDRELSLVRLRAHGEMALRVTDAGLFVNKVVGARGIYAAKELDGFMKSIVLSSLAQTLGGILDTIFDLPVLYDQIATATKARVFDEFASYGTELVDFVIEAITPPEEVQARIDERSGMGAVGNLDNYLRFKSALAVGEAATNPGGAGSALDAAVGLGLGMSVMRSAQEGTSQAGSGAANAALNQISCPSCTKRVPGESIFCLHCGSSITSLVCVKCGQPLEPESNFCAACGTAVGSQDSASTN